MQARKSRVLIALFRAGGTANMAKVQKAAKIDRSVGFHLAQTMIEDGHIRHVDRNEYRLTRTGARKAKQLQRT
jgi:predicted transcriptional regulator